MNDLLNLAVEAHGGLKRWSRLKAVTAAASITGEIWRLKSKPDYLKNVIFKVETKREHVTMDFPGQNKRSVFEPNHVEMQRRDGAIVAPATIPKRGFRGMSNSRHGMISTLRTLAERHFIPSKALGRTITYQDIPVEPWRENLFQRGLSAHLVNHLATMADLHRVGRYDRMTDDVFALTGQKPLSMQEFVRNNAAAFTDSAKAA